MITFLASGDRNSSDMVKSLLAMTILAAVAAVTAPSSAHAQVIVVQSSAKGINAGTLLSNSTPLSIPAGAKVVLVLPSGATRTLAGPFKGRAGDLTKGVKSNPSIFDAVKRYVRTGGSNNKSVGAVRSMAPAAFALGKPLPFSWRAVPVTASGDFCIEKGAAVSIARTRTRNAQNITIIELRSRRRVQVRFPAGAQNIAWPDDLEIASGARFALVRGDRPPQEMRIRVITPLPKREETLQILHGQRCQTQFRAFIREMQSAG